jgi:hypothetical protein
VMDFALVRMIKGKIVPVLQNLNTASLRRMGEWSYFFTILGLGTKWR